MDSIQEKLKQRWHARSPLDVANQLSSPLFGGAGDWDLPDDVKSKRDLLYLAVGIPDSEALPKQALQQASDQVFSRPGDVALRYGFGLGPANIRRWLAKMRSANEDTQVDERWFQLTNGSSGAIDLIVRSLINPGEVIIAESPTYMGTLHNFRGVGAELKFVPMDEQGISTDALAKLLIDIKAEGKKVKLIYTISAFQNPTGITLSHQRRMDLLALAYEHDVLILDDEAYRDLWFDEPAPRALSAMADNWGVITTGTFSKTVATGLRVGWIHARPEMLDLFGRMRFGMGQNQHGLRAFGEFLGSGQFEPHLLKVRDLYCHKRDLLLLALNEHFSEYADWQVPEGGFYIWAKLHADIDETSLWRTAIEEGIAINRGSGFGAQALSHDQYIRIAYAWTPVAHFAEAARRLGLAAARVRAGKGL